MLCLGFEGKKYFFFPYYCLPIFKAGSLEFWQDVLGSIRAAQAGNMSSAHSEVPLASKEVDIEDVFTNMHWGEGEG